MAMAEVKPRKLPHTERRLAANRANLLKANAVPREVMYRPTEKRLAANRANLLKAKAAPKELIYRPTEKRLAAARQNLVKANAVPAYLRYASTAKRRVANRANLESAHAAQRLGGGRFHHGLYALSLPGSLARAGESREAFEEHLARFARAFAPVGTVERRLIQAAAETAWRRLRGFHGQARWEAHRLARLLDRAGEAARRLPRSLDRDRFLAQDILGVFESHAPLMGHLHRVTVRLERLLRTFLRQRSRRLPDLEVVSRCRADELRLLEAPGLLASNPLTSAQELAKWMTRGVDRVLAGHPLESLPSLAAEQTAPGADAPASFETIPDLESCLRAFEVAFGAAGPDDCRHVRAAGGVAWNRLALFRDRARQEETELELILECAALLHPAKPEQLCALAGQVLELFADDLPTFQSAGELYDELTRSLQEVLTHRYGQGPDSQLFPAEAARAGPQTLEEMVSEFLR